MNRTRGSRLLALLVACLAVAIALGGCGDEERGTKTIRQAEKEGLSSKLMQLSNVYERYGVLARSAYTTEEEAVLEVRLARKPWEKLGDADAAKLKEEIYDAVGYSFDLRIDSFVLPEQADVAGKITALDGDGVLVVGDSRGDSGPAATWMKFPSGMTDTLKIGYRVNAWSDGMFEESYPSRTDGVQLQVVDFAVGDGDAKGTITAVNAEDSDENKRYVEIDGKKLRLMPFTRYLKDGESAKAGELRVGALAQAWTAGYTIGEEQYATQVNVVTAP